MELGWGWDGSGAEVGWMWDGGGVEVGWKWGCGGRGGSGGVRFRLMSKVFNLMCF